MVASISTRPLRSWTGDTRGMGTNLTIVHAPEHEAEQRIARAVLEYAIDTLGNNRAQEMTSEELFAHYCNS